MTYKVIQQPPPMTLKRNIGYLNAASFGLGYLKVLAASGSHASTPDHASISTFTDSIDLRVDVMAVDWDDNFALIDKTNGSPKSYGFYVDIATAVKRLYWEWYETGEVFRGEIATAALTVSDGERLQVRVTMDFDNGASQREVKFYQRAISLGLDLSDNTNWTQVGTTVTGAVTNMQVGTQIAYLGSWPGGAPTWTLNGQIYEAQIRGSIDGPIVANPDFRYRTDLLNYVELDDLTNDYVQTPDHASLDVTDLDVRVDYMADDWDDVHSIINREVGTNGSFSLYVRNTGPGPKAMQLQWWSGAAYTSGHFDVSSIVLPVNDGERLQIRCTVDTNNGAGSYETKFWYRSPSLGLGLTDNSQWTQLGTTVSAATATFYSGANSELALGAWVGGAGAWTLDGRIYEALYLDGIDGAVVAHPDFRQGGMPDESGKVWSYFNSAKSGNDPTKLTDSTGKVWTVNGTAWRVLPLQGTEPIIVPPSVYFDILRRRNQSTLALDRAG